MNEIKMDLNLLISEANEQAISKQVLPTMSESFCERGNSAFANMDLASSERYRSPEMNYPQRTWRIVPNSKRNVINLNSHNKENSFKPHSSNYDYDRSSCF